MTDFIGQQLSIGDKIAINSRGFNNTLAAFQVRTITGFTNKFILLEKELDKPTNVNKTTSNLAVKINLTTKDN